MDTAKRPQCCQVSGCGLCSPLVGCGAWPSFALVGGGSGPSSVLVVCGGGGPSLTLRGGWWWDLAAGHVAALLLCAVTVIWLSSRPSLSCHRQVLSSLHCVTIIHCCCCHVVSLSVGGSG